MLREIRQENNTILHNSFTQIVAFDEVPELPSLYDLDLSGNQIEGIKEIEKLSGLKSIKILNVGGNESLDGLGDGIKK